jgi:tRNA pseudouridine55 synthase
MTNPQSSILNPQSQEGVLLINKPADWTSHDVVAKLRKVLKTRRIGHTGTLDPFATGVLVVCVNRATRLVQFLTADEKEYVATMRLGVMTDTGDFTGTPVGEAKDASQITADDINAVLPSFRGVIQQTPPMYSAKKIAGQKLYELARRGETVERAAIAVEIKELELLSGSAGKFTFRVVCSTGTYIRTLAEDIGLQLGVGAHLLALQRTRVAAHKLANTQTLSDLTEGRELPRLLPMNAALDLPELLVNETECAALFNGKVLHRAPLNDAITQAKCVAQSGAIIAIVEYNAAKNGWQPRVVFN